MARGDHYPAPRAHFMHRPGDRRGRGIGVRQPAPDPVPRSDFDHPFGEFPGQETPVVAYHHPFFRQPLPVQVIHGRLRHDGQVGKGEVAGDNPAPPVGTKFDLHVSPSDSTILFSCNKKKAAGKENFPGNTVKTGAFCAVFAYIPSWRRCHVRTYFQTFYGRRLYHHPGRGIVSSREGGTPW